MCDLGITLKLAQPSSLASFPPHFFLRLQSLKLFTTVAQQGHFGPFRVLPSVTSITWLSGPKSGTWGKKSIE